jgi:hypothetical protein
MRRLVVILLVLTTGCTHHARANSRANGEVQIRRLLAPAAVSSRARLEVEILIFGTETRATLIRLVEFNNGGFRADIAQWVPDDVPASERHLSVRRWEVDDVMAVQNSLTSFRNVVVPLAPDERVILHGTQFIITATSGISKTRLEMWLEHPDGSASSGPMDAQFDPVAKWLTATLEELGVEVFQSQ